MRQFAAAVSAYRAGDISEGDLYRTIMAWPAWRVVAQRADDGATMLGVLTDPRGLRVLELFSDDEAWQAFRERESEAWPDRMLQMAGHELFSTLADELVQRINLDLHSPHATHFFEQQIPMLRAWAEVVTVELALAVPDRVGDPFGVLRRFDGYNVLVETRAAERAMVLAPDDHGRTLAAVFTADDTVDEFVAAMSASLDGRLEIERVAGAELFAMLGRMALDGIVFNPLTHLPPVALSASVIERILAS